ncbi:tyrosine-type recombinase/integrase [Donghicola mangrovi]|uniref:Tyrosine-type recombinase/integrase n=1 Tax=Donghicola mangrovi TaxID=2729614 RepID=A0A850PZD0_9RHOB|nr:tyrosine-type recombinase/integrase [Donghicola mangrovi]NVO22637.1 tyrosine-type recombinase/integrase [Donghicola mangrovi]
MQYLRQKNGKGWFFRMTTPTALIGQANPWDGRELGKEIIKGLGTRRIGEAKKLRDIYLADIRRMERYGADVASYDAEAAKAMRAELKSAAQRDPEEGWEVASIVHDKAMEAMERGADRQMISSYLKTAFGKGFALSDALDQYKAARSPDNTKSQFAPLAKQSFNDLGSAVDHLCRFLNAPSPEQVMLQDLSKPKAVKFRYDYLPNICTHRAPHGLSAKTIKKNVTLLKGIWDWAAQVGHVPPETANVWATETRVRARTEHVIKRRRDFSPEEATALLRASRRGTREGDVLRLALATGCRISEIALLRREYIETDCSGFFISEGKTQNALRFVPVVAEAQAVLSARFAFTAGQDRLFPEWPVRESSGKSGAVSQWFTRFRREVLGEQTDKSLSLHSTRHTWRTVARRARVSEADILQLGGWSTDKSQADKVYDHGLTKRQLSQAQTTVWDALIKNGYLNSY